MDAGVQRKVLHNNGTVKLSVQDIFNQLQYDRYRNFGGLNYSSQNKWESQQIKLSFGLRFGNQNVKAPAKKKDPAAEERGRMGGG